MLYVASCSSRALLELFVIGMISYSIHYSGRGIALPTGVDTEPSRGYPPSRRPVRADAEKMGTTTRTRSSGPSREMLGRGDHRAGQAPGAYGRQGGRLGAGYLHEAERAAASVALDRWPGVRGRWGGPPCPCDSSPRKRAVPSEQDLRERTTGIRPRATQVARPDPVVPLGAELSILPYRAGITRDSDVVVIIGVFWLTCRVVGN